MVVAKYDFPPQPEGLTGWPWAEESELLPPLMSNGKAWPKISIVTPNYNGALYIEKTIRSVLLQGYPNLEYIIIDGGSSDNSVEIIKRYEQWLTYWVSEKDNGQSDAINKGFARCTGEIVNWLCSDDILLPRALFRVAFFFLNNPGVGVVAGQGHVVFASGDRPDMIGGTTQEAVELIPANNSVCQPACFYHRKLLDRTPPIDESYYYAMDFELWAYFHSKDTRWLVVEDILCQTLMTGDNKCSTGGIKITEEQIRVYRTYTNERIPLTFWYQYLRLPLERFRSRYPNRVTYLLVRPLQISVGIILGLFYGFRRVRGMSFFHK